MAAIITCPSCRKSLQVPDELLGQRVQCPECRNVFATEAPRQSAPAHTGTTSVPPPPMPSNPPPAPSSPPVSTAPSKPPVWEKPNPLRRKRRRDEDDDDEDDRDEDDDRPRRRRRSRRRSPSDGGDYGAPHRGGLILALGILSFFFPLLGLIMGATVWSMASNDLRAMREGYMDPSGQGPTQVGHVFAIIATLVWIVPCLAFCSLGVFSGGLRRW